MVCFASSFRSESSDNITHATLDGERTLCGRSGWETSEGWSDLGPDCLRCARSLAKGALEAFSATQQMDMVPRPSETDPQHRETMTMTARSSRWQFGIRQGPPKYTKALIKALENQGYTLWEARGRHWWTYPRGCGDAQHVHLDFRKIVREHGSANDQDQLLPDLGDLLRCPAIRQIELRSQEAKS
jgi:hypothetical protein